MAKVHAFLLGARSRALLVYGCAVSGTLTAFHGSGPGFVLLEAGV